MGKGAGNCVSSTASEPPAPVPTPAAIAAPPAARSAPSAVPAPPATVAVVSPVPMATYKFAIVFYSLYGHTYALAKEVKKGIDAVEGCEGVLLQVPETLSEDILAKMYAPPKPDVPLATTADLGSYDGVIWGMSGRYGSAPAQIRTFFDSTGQLWQKGALIGKGTGVFVSTGNLGGGQETIAMSSMPFFVHQGMVFIPMGYSNPMMFSTSEVHGGSPWGAGMISAGDGSRQASAWELSLAEHHGSSFAKIAKKLAAK